MSPITPTLMCMCTLLVTMLVPMSYAQMFNDPNPNYRALAKSNGYFSYGQSTTTTVQPSVGVSQVALNSLYAFFALIILFAIIAGIVWGCVCCCCRETHKRRKHSKH